jgi:NADPH:quinone reductase-like Zn-dependent oxidoreductase
MGTTSKAVEVTWPRLAMETEFRAIVQSEYGAPAKVLKIAKRRLRSEELGSDDVFVKVLARPIHHGDIHILSGLPQGGPVEPVLEGTLRVPGFEGVGTIVRLGTNAKAATTLSEAQRVAFFSRSGFLGRICGRSIQLPLGAAERDCR